MLLIKCLKTKLLEYDVWLLYVITHKWHDSVDEQAHYVGKLENGNVFDSSYNRGNPFHFVSALVMYIQQSFARSGFF